MNQYVTQEGTNQSLKTKKATIENVESIWSMAIHKFFVSFLYQYDSHSVSSEEPILTSMTLELSLVSENN